MKISETIEDGLNYMREYGWKKGDLGARCASKPVCMLGAFSTVDDLSQRNRVFQYLENAILALHPYGPHRDQDSSGSLSTVWQFNDLTAKDFHDIEQAMILASKLAEEDGK